MIGFTYFDTKPIVVKPTIAELVASLSSADKVLILNGFTKKILPRRLKYLTTVSEQVIKHLYRAIDAVEERSRELMCGETPPSTANQLLTQIQDEFSDDFTSGQVNAILTKMVQYSRFDGSGDWTFYRNNVIL